ncbi:hypothetical protein EBZ80_18790 [bacterium]|nr:hypothetical protein [bacterium]
MKTLGQKTALALALAGVTTLATVACKSASFQGASEIGPRSGVTNNGLPGTSDWPPPPAGNPITPNSTPAPAIPTTSLEIVYDAHEADDNSRWKGTYVYSLQRAGAQPVQILAYNAGATGAATVPGICQCGVSNDFDLIVSAGNMTQNLAAWHNEAIASHTRPTSGSDITKFFNKHPKYQSNPHTIFFGGFDHIFLGFDWCPNSPFACDTRKWNNRDDNAIIFSCNVAACPNGGPGTRLNFDGQDN